jgi:hypothetical protein
MAPQMNHTKLVSLQMQQTHFLLPDGAMQYELAGRLSAKTDGFPQHPINTNRGTNFEDQCIKD